MFGGGGGGCEKKRKGNPTTWNCKQQTLSNLTVVPNSLLGIIHGNNVLVLEAG